MRSLRMELGDIKMRFVVAALSLIGALALAGTPDNHEYRLPTHFRPIRYKLDITTHLEDEFAYEGVVRIRVVCTHAVDTVVLHATEMQIDVKGVRVDDGFRESVELSGVTFNQTEEFMYVKCAVNLQVNHEYVLTVPFGGKITDNMVGYYRSSYVDKATNQTRWLAVTQFEPASARRAFPCFDEPAMKAKFKITMGHKKQLTSASNMPLANTTPHPSRPDYVVDEFEETPPMSTYLVAYLVSDYELAKASNRRGVVNFRVLARKDALSQTEIAKKLGPTVLRFYEKYFNQDYPLHKLDMVAVPDFTAGAMENWGLVTFREAELLVDIKVATISDIYSVADIIAHELAHQWFGNLVTMKWWTDLWLNEGFATYLASLGVNYVFPEWNSFHVDTVHNFMAVMDMDSYVSSHPVSMPVGHPDEIAQIFDTISYRKGSCLLHMINAFLGENTFKQGIRKYLSTYRFSNAEQDDLWSVLTDEAHKVGALNKSITLKEIMDPWTLQTGYPVVKVVRNYTDNTMTISQRRFVVTKSVAPDEKSCWWVPLTMTYASESKFSKTKVQTWLNCENNNFTMTLKNNEDWVIFNIQMAGLYRVLYDDQNWLNIMKMLNSPNGYKSIHTTNRAQLIEDALTFAYAGDLDYRIAFQILKVLLYEKEYTPWLAALNGLHRIGNLMRRTPSQRIYQGYMRRLVTSVYHRMRDMYIDLKGFEEIFLRNLIIGSACRNLMKNCTDQALELFRKWMKTAEPSSSNILPKELKSAIYCHALKHGAEEEWYFLWNHYLRSNVAAEKSRILVSLGCTSKILLLKKYLTWTIGENAVIRKQDAIMVFNAVASNDFGFVAAKNFLYDNIEKIHKYFYPQNDLVGLYIKAIGSQLKTKKELDDIQSFIKKSAVYLKGSEMVINQTIETININIEWMSKFYFKISNFLIHM